MDGGDEGAVGARSAAGEVSMLGAISRAMVGLYRELGRGPTSVRTDWGGPNLIVSTLEDTLVPERNLVAMGEHQRLRDVRMFFQYATVAEFCAPVERLSGRRVRSILGGIDTAVDGLASRPSSSARPASRARRASRSRRATTPVPRAGGSGYPGPGATVGVRQTTSVEAGG